MAKKNNKPKKEFQIELKNEVSKNVFFIQVFLHSKGEIKEYINKYYFSTIIIDCYQLIHGTLINIKL